MPCQLLLVEDDQRICQALGLALADEGYHAVEADDLPIIIVSARTDTSEARRAGGAPDQDGVPAPARTRRGAPAAW